MYFYFLMQAPIINFFLLTYIFYPCLCLCPLSLIPLSLTYSACSYFTSSFPTLSSLSTLPYSFLYSVISNSIVGQYLRLSRERPGFESPLESFYFFYFYPICHLFLSHPYCLYGGVAQMVEHSLCMRGARGSIPRTSIFLFFLYLPYKKLLKFVPLLFILYTIQTKNDNGRVRTYAPKGKLLSRQPP